MCCLTPFCDANPFAALEATVTLKGDPQDWRKAAGFVLIAVRRTPRRVARWG